MSKSFLSKLALVACALVLGNSAARAAALDINLASGSGDVENIGGTLFVQGQVGSGSGVYTSLYRLQRSGGSSTERGYNNFSASSPNFDQVGGVGILQINLADLPVVNIAGTNYISINFDINNASGLTFTDFRIYLNSDPTNTNTPISVTSEANLGNLGSLVYTMDGTSAGGTNTLQMNNIPTGSGTDDMTINIPLSYFTSIPGWTLTDDVYIWANLSGATGGFEEFAFVLGGPDVESTLIPEAHTVWGGGAMVVGLLLGGIWQRRRKAAAVTA